MTISAGGGRGKEGGSGRLVSEEVVVGGGEGQEKRMRRPNVPALVKTDKGTERRREKDVTGGEGAGLSESLSEGVTPRLGRG